jgi:cytochrome P450
LLLFIPHQQQLLLCRYSSEILICKNENESFHVLTVHRFYDLVTIPGLVQVLRAEMEDVLEKHDGVLSNKALYDMKLLDSVMKESQRMNPLGLTGFTRMTMENGITLPDGSYVPPHTFMEAPIEAIHRDPSIYKNADTFDPYRFYNMRKKDEDAGKHQFVTLGTGVLSFGIGRHACPGRFFAANEIKLIVINILRNFDMEQKEKGPRYPNMAYSITNSADPSRELMFKKVRS